MKIFDKKKTKKGKKMADILDIEENPLPENKIIEAFTPPEKSLQINSKKTSDSKTQINQSEIKESFLVPDNENYQAFSKVKEHGATAISIDIRMKDEQYFLMNCHLIKGCSFYGNTRFEISYDNDIFKFRGKNLLQIKQYLQHQKILHLQEFDANKHISPIPQNMPLISNIKWVKYDDIIDDNI